MPEDVGDLKFFFEMERCVKLGGRMVYHSQQLREKNGWEATKHIVEKTT